jgi:hypothetical protein
MNSIRKAQIRLCLLLFIALGQFFVHRTVHRTSYTDSIFWVMEGIGTPDYSNGAPNQLHKVLVCKDREGADK